MLKDYEEFLEGRAKQYGEFPDDTSAEIIYCALGIGGEAGEVVDAVKKLWRDQADVETTIVMELGDLAYYTLRMAAALGFTLEEVLHLNQVKLEYRDRHGKDKEGEREAVEEAIFEMDEDEEEFSF